jgi:Holliday junction resolvase RusA-like endonuclease
MKKITLRIETKPVPWQRQKTSLVNGWVHHYSADKTKEYERQIANYYLQATKCKYDEKQPICVNLVFGMPIPKSTPKSRKMAMAEGIVRHTNRPDVDNLAKSVLDALNGIAWVDDSQIVKLSAEKHYSIEPYVYIYIHESVD